MAYQQQPGYGQQQPGHMQPGGYPGQQPPVMLVSHQSAAPAPSVYGQCDPISITCPGCNSKTMTKTAYKVTTNQIIFYIVLFLFYPIICCAPCYYPTCYRVEHRCANCSHFIGASQ